MFIGFGKREYICWSPDFAPSTTAPPAPVTIDAEDVTGTLAQNPARQYPMRTHADIKRIVIHHTATPSNITVERIAQFQVQNKGLPGITYHFCVTAEGRVLQTQYLETVSAHAGEYSQDSIGLCLIGNFMSASPPRIQLDATAALLAELLLFLGLTTSQVVGYSELVTTGSPGATWPRWKRPLLNMVSRLMRSGKPITMPKPVTAAPMGKTIDHYLLLWHNSPADWADLVLEAALNYIGQFKPTVGFSVEQAKSAKYVTIVGGTDFISANTERNLKQAGCKVERIAGKTEVETGQILQKLAAQGKRFMKLK